MSAMPAPHSALPCEVRAGRLADSRSAPAQMDGLVAVASPFPLESSDANHEMLFGASQARPAGVVEARIPKIRNPIFPPDTLPTGGGEGVRGRMTVVHVSPCALARVVLETRPSPALFPRERGTPPVRTPRSLPSFKGLTVT
jgi:hypothetical protein